MDFSFPETFVGEEPLEPQPSSPVLEWEDLEKLISTFLPPDGSSPPAEAQAPTDPRVEECRYLLPDIVAWEQIDGLSCGDCKTVKEIVYSNDRHRSRLSVHEDPKGGLYHAVMNIQSLVDQIFAQNYFADLRWMTAQMQKQFVKNYIETCFMQDLAVSPEDLKIHVEVSTPTIITYEEGSAPPQHMEAAAVHSHGVNREQQIEDLPTTRRSLKATKKKPNTRRLLTVDDLSAKLAQADLLGSKASKRAKNNMSNKQWTEIVKQRNRIKMMTIHDIEQYFHLPEIVAAKKLKIGTSALKKLCRRFNIGRWPYRKVIAKKRPQNKTQEVTTPS